MPNKHKNAKLRTKLLLSGKLNKKQEVQSTLKYIAEKTAIDNEDINYDFENEKNDFGKLDSDDDDTRKIKTPKKRKLPSVTKPKIFEDKKPKLDKEPAKNGEGVLPKKSKKNKYFFMAHPEALDKKDEIISSAKSNFVIDARKIAENSLKKSKNAKNKQNNNSEVKVEKENKKDLKKNKKNDNLWKIEECSSSSEDESEKKDQKKPEPKRKSLVLDIDVDKSFKLKKTYEKLEDGTVIQVFKPEIVQTNDDEEPEDDENQDEPSLTLNESDEGENEEEEDIEEEKNNKEVESSINNPAMEKLKSSRFRYLNELLYTQPSSKSFEFFQNDEDSFKAYHEGFKNQINKWPLNPLDKIIKYIKSRPANLVVADFGCGEAKLAQSVKNKVHSFDLVAANEFVVRCDMKKVPLEAGSCDIVVFCLSLMGTNVVDFLCEAHRVLKQKGVLKIAEVVSRIADKNDFIKKIEAIGFKLVSKKDEISEPKTKDYFYFFDFVKMSPTVKKKPNIKLNPCLYKKR